MQEKRDVSEYREPLQDLRNKVAVVTGGSAGIGAATVGSLRDLGTSVAVVDPVPNENADIWIEGNVSTGTDVTRAFAETNDALGTVSILVNNAGKAPPGRFVELSEEDWLQTLDVNLTSVFRCTREYLAQLGSETGGAVVNVASIAGRHRSFTANAAYSAAKGGILSLTRQLAQELAPERVRVNCVCPGLIATSIMDRNIDDARRAELASGVPQGRLGEPGEVASTITFLASEAASYMTGAVVDINGGLL